MSNSTGAALTREQDESVFGDIWWLVKTAPALIAWGLLYLHAAGFWNFQDWSPQWVTGLLWLIPPLLVITLVQRYIWPGARVLYPWGDALRGRRTRTDKKGVAEIDKPLTRKIVRGWAKTARHVGLVSGDEIAALTRVHSYPGGLALDIEVPRGLTAESVGAVTDTLASLWRVPAITAARVSPYQAQLQIGLRDPLDGVRSASPPPAVLGPLTVGRGASGGDVTIDLRDASHVAIQGMTRSGKSVFCYGLLSQLVGLDEVRLMGIDPNAVLLDPWRSSTLPGDVAVGSDPVAAQAVIDRAVAVLDERLGQMPAQGVEKIAAFTATQPLVVVVLEEYPGLIRAAALYDQGQKAADKIGPRIRAGVGRLVSEGAKAGIRVILITQRADAEIVDGATRAQMGTRITFAVDNLDAVRMLHPEASTDVLAKVVRFPAGRALVWQHRHEQIMQADYLDYDAYRARLGGGRGVV